jgi:hypothetical protein
MLTFNPPLFSLLNTFNVCLTCRSNSSTGEQLCVSKSLAGNYTMCDGRVLSGAKINRCGVCWGGATGRSESAGQGVSSWPAKERNIKGIKRNFLLQVFSMNHLPPSPPENTNKCHLECFKKFAVIFASQGAPTVSTAPVVAP